jgi:hypothetical protein
MKRIYFLIVFIFMLFPAQLFSQCPGCVVDMSCTVSPAKPVLCPDTMPPGMAMQYYDEDITFYMPAQFVDDGTGFNVTLNRIELLGIVGLPFGLNLQSSSSNDNFYPSSNPPSTERGCAKICGTPVIPGQYSITVFVRAYVTVLGLNQTQDDSFEIPITILPSASGNSSFSISNPYGCSPVVTSFQTLHPSNGNPGFQYSWNFGNGQTSNSETPPSQTYSVPGTYPVSLMTTIDTLGYLLSSVSVSNVQCDDGIWGAPDPFIKIFESNSLIYQSNYVDDTYSATFNFSAINLNNVTYKIEVWDYDSGLLGGDDFCGMVLFNGHIAGNYSLNASGMIVSFTVDHPVIEFNDTDTIEVLPSPQIIGINALPGLTACTGDSVQLLVQSNATSWQWFKDSAALVGHILPSMFAHQSGAYFVLASNDVGCSASSDTLNVSFLTYPPVPTFWQSGNTLETMMSGYSLQWYFEGDPIPGATSQILQITQSGLYMLEATNIICASYSNEYYAQYTGIDDVAGFFNPVLFPNPAKEMLTFRFDSKTDLNIIMRISDMTGRVVSMESIVTSSGNQIIQTDISHLNSGMYLIEFMTEKGRLTQRFIRE